MTDDTIGDERKTFAQRVLDGIPFSFRDILLVSIPLIGLYFTIAEIKENSEFRKAEAIARAWSTLTTPAPGNSGKGPALEYLASQGLPLNGIDVSCSAMGGTELRKNGKKDCVRRTYLANLDLSKSKGVSLKKAKFSYADLSEANLSGADLVGAELIGAKLIGANLIGANLIDANLIDAKLIDAKLIDAKLENAKLENAKLENAKLENANLAIANLGGANLLGANLEGANLGGANLEGANIIGANIIGAKLRGANIIGANLSGKNIENANLGGVNIRGANFSSANLSGVDFTRSTIDNGTNFQDAWAWRDRKPIGLDADITFCVFNPEIHRRDIQKWPDSCARPE